MAASFSGLGGDDPTRPDWREPFDLTGAAERIDQVAQTGIAEPPVIEIHYIASDEQPGTGYLSVVIPAAPRAPHMVRRHDQWRESVLAPRRDGQPHSQ